MTSSTNYAAARAATLSAAADLYGAGSPEVNGVAAAWAAVNVN
jgi:Zn-dependent metalloprotease